MKLSGKLTVWSLNVKFIHINLERSGFKTAHRTPHTVWTVREVAYIENDDPNLWKAKKPSKATHSKTEPKLCQN